MRTTKGLFVVAIAAVTITAVSCGDSPVQPTALSPLAPDTGNLGLVPVAGFPAFALLDDSVVTEPTIRARLIRRRTDPEVAAARVVRFANGLDSVLALGRPLAFDVSPTRRLVFLLSRGSQQPVSGHTFWTGLLQGGGTGDITLIRQGDITAGSLHVIGKQTAHYAIETLGDGFDLIVYIDYRKYLPD